LANITLPVSGKGGFGSVYIGKYSGKLVAIKQLHAKSQGKASPGESFCAELNAFRLHHPNIVKIVTFSCSGPYTQVRKVSYIFQFQFSVFRSYSNTSDVVIYNSSWTKLPESCRRSNVGISVDKSRTHCSSAIRIECCIWTSNRPTY
jgi:serine/threonine protein kinase